MTEQATIEDLARAADDAGARLADGINDLADRLTPRRMVDNALNAAKSRGSELARDAGLAVYAGGRISRAELDIDNDLDGYTDYDDPFIGAADEPAAPAVNRIADTADDARELVSENPVLAILAGLAAGAAMAMLFPSSDSERRSLGKLGKRLAGV